METDLWSEASRDIVAERRTRDLEMAKAASQGTWAFLALAQSPEEYGDRVALAADQITATASAAGVEVADLVGVFDSRFALLMEAKGNPFGDDDSDDSDDSDSDSDDSDSSSDDDSSDDDSDDSDSGDGDDDSDDSSSDDSSDSSGDDSDGGDSSAPPWANKFSALHAAIQQGSNPLEWGGTPFARSSARKEAADGAGMPGEGGTADPSVPGEGGQANALGPQNPEVPGMNGGIAETTKPRQMPGGGEMDPTMAPGMGMDGIDPGLNGGDIEQGADDLPPADDSARTAKISAIASEVRKYNPTLSLGQCRKVANRVYDQYLVKHAEDMNPLLFGDRGGVADGPATHRVKTWAPEDLKPGGDSGGPDKNDGMPNIPKIPKLPKFPGGGGAAAGEAAGIGGGGGAGGAAAGAGMAAELGEAAELLPLLAL